MITLIGPQKAGKTTVGHLLAAWLNRPFVDLDRAGRRYWHEIGYDADEAERRWRTRRFENAYRYLWPFQAHAVVRGLEDYGHAVIELGALQSVYEDPALFQHVQVALAARPYIIYLRPSADTEAALKVLRNRDQVFYNGEEIINYFVRHPSNYALAKHIVYTQDRTPAQTCDEILRLIDTRAREIILIGPPDTGKSTQGELLSQRLDRPRAAVDRLRYRYYAELGYDDALRWQIQEREGFAGVVRYWKQYDLYAVARTLADHPGHIIDFGAGHSVFDDPEREARLHALLKPYPNVILLLPAPDPDESTAILHERRQLRIGINGQELNRFLIESPCNDQLATQIVYTDGQTPRQTRDAILRLMGT